jgi:hypothetical protein
MVSFVIGDLPGDAVQAEDQRAQVADLDDLHVGARAFAPSCVAAARLRRG